MSASEIVTELPPIRRGGRPSKYPWSEWADGRTHRISQGEHFTVPPRSIVSELHTHARSRGMTVTTRTGDSSDVYFQFSGGEDA